MSHVQRRREEANHRRQPRFPCVVIVGVMACLVLRVYAWAQPPPQEEGTRTTVLVGADLLGYRSTPHPPLIGAAAVGDVAQVRALLAAGADPNQAVDTATQDPAPAPGAEGPAEEVSP